MSTAEKLQKKKFLFSNVQSLKVTSTKMSALMMFSEIGKLRARKKILLLGPESVFKDYDAHSVNCGQKVRPGSFGR